MANPLTPLGARTLREIASQPDCWTRAVAAVERWPGLPETGERVLALGCGTSFYIAQAYAALREAAGQGHTDAVVASELPERLRSYDRAVAISRSGTSVELNSAVEALAGDVPVTALLGATDTALAAAADQIVDLGFADEESVVQTRFPTTVLSLLRAHLGERLDDDIDAARAALAAELPQPPERQLVVLGHGWSVALAHEAALKCREAAAAWVEAYPAGEYRHGPLAVADQRTLVWGLSPLPPSVVDAATATGARVQQPAHPPQAELVLLQRLAVAWASSRGRDADRPPRLSRSVVDV